MKVLEIPYSDNLPDVIQLSGVAFEQDMKMALATKLFELGRLSSVPAGLNRKPVTGKLKSCARRAPFIFS